MSKMLTTETDPICCLVSLLPILLINLLIIHLISYLIYLIILAYCLLPIAYCLIALLPIAYAYCLLPIAYCLLPGWMHSAAWTHTAAECILPPNAYCL